MIVAGLNLKFDFSDDLSRPYLEVTKYTEYPWQNLELGEFNISRNTPFLIETDEINAGKKITETIPEIAINQWYSLPKCPSHLDSFLHLVWLRPLLFALCSAEAQCAFGALISMAESLGYFLVKNVRKYWIMILHDI